jgi:hypothetical protein
MKEAEAKLARREVQPAPPVERPGYADQIDGWKDVATKAFGQDPSEFTNALNQMSSLQAKAAASEVMEQFLGHQSAQTKQADFERQSQDSWDRALGDFHELRDQNSELYQQSLRIWQNDPNRETDPDAMYKAAAITFGLRARAGGSPPPQLEGSKLSSAPSTESSPIKAGYDRALDGLKSSNKDQLRSFLESNWDVLTGKKK